MTGINWKRVVAGGLVAGVMVNAGGIALGHFVLGQEYIKRFFDRLGHQPTGWTMAGHLAVRMEFGLVAAFLYTAMRPRFGPGPKTALAAATVVYMTCYLLLSKVLYDFDILVGWRLGVSLVWGAAEIALAACAAGYIYKESPAVVRD